MGSPLKQLPRRLFELLEEQQEPFLLENGFSRRRCFKCEGTFRCWSLSNHGFRRRRARNGILHCFLARSVCWKAIKRALKWERAKLAGCLSEIRSEANAGGFHRLSGFSGEIKGNKIEHSPVSVLELHSYEASSDQNHSMDEENSSTSRLNSPTYSLPIRPRQLLLDFLEEMEERDCHPCEFLGQKMGTNIMKQEEIFPWEKQREDVPMFSDLLSLDLSATKREWTQFQAEKREIGTKIGGMIFEEMRVECVYDMLGFCCTLKT
ncbi:uncharacterized protein A4U43_C03F7800 [Asparagus officinalis]|uniref:DUF4378 domain-containing protein n=1 Tax=Asparagus officinalis TaxID=4686 RepID=A0A5P1F870_ASPOF|nr:uncharacterized protein LOC109833202 [Asparagus officinalis]ONK74568.1 uncharacterized protein A4U43_C03F7800 [Asparagus officinalis]